MRSCHCEATEHHFDQAFVEAELDRQTRTGPPTATRLLLDALKTLDLRSAVLLDVGGGTGTLMQELFAEGLIEAVLVEMSSAYLKLAEAEARRRGYHARVRYVHGDFMNFAESISRADLVTLNRVICCYPDAECLVETSAASARRWYALSYPRDRWYVRMVTACRNRRRRRRGNPFRTYLHDDRRIGEILQRAGFRQCYHRATWFWKVCLYRREHPDENR